jgi:serine/threonine protein kinase
VAIKVLDKDKIQKQNMGSQIKKEISIMKMVKHPHVVELVEVLASKTKIFIVLELVTGGELFDEIVKEGKLCEADGRVYFKQLCNAVMYCHSKGTNKNTRTQRPILVFPSRHLAHTFPVSFFSLFLLPPHPPPSPPCRGQPP